MYYFAPHYCQPYILILLNQLWAVPSGHGGGLRYKLCTYIYAFLPILLCREQLEGTPTPNCTKVPKHFCDLRENSDAHPINCTFVHKFWQNRRFFQEFFKKNQKYWTNKNSTFFSRIFQKKWKKFRFFFKFGLFFCNFFRILTKICVQKYQSTLCFVRKWGH